MHMLNIPISVQKCVDDGARGKLHPAALGSPGRRSGGRPEQSGLWLGTTHAENFIGTKVQPEFDFV